MRFGALAIDAARGGILAHAVRVPGLTLPKGTIINTDMIDRLRAHSVERVTVALLEDDDVPEDEAARALAAGAAGEHVRCEAPFTGRVNLFAEKAGVLVVDEAAVNRLNAVDEALTFATLKAYQAVQPGTMVATAKIIPYAVARRSLDAAVPFAPLLRVAPYCVRRVGLIQTRLPGLADKVIQKTVRVTAERLRPTGASLVSDSVVPHDEGALAAALAAMAPQVDLLIVFGASAVADRRDVIPAAIVAAGGAVHHFGMPVDPGNLLLLGALGSVPVVGAPGCARSPRENGFDWILARLLAGLPISRADIAGLGVGGLLMEIVTRPQPREGTVPSSSGRFAAVVLAAGRSSRMQGANKLLEEVGGLPMIRHAVRSAREAGIGDIVVVTGHQGERVRAALADEAVVFVDNPHFAEGLSTSLAAGLSALPPNVDAALVMLGDMPFVGAELLGRLCRAYDPASGAQIVVPVVGARRGNPVLWGRRFFSELMAVSGDQGGRSVLLANGDAVHEIEAGDGVLIDLDTPQALDAARRGVADVPQT